MGIIVVVARAPRVAVVVARVTVSPNVLLRARPSPRRKPSWSLFPSTNPPYAPNDPAPARACARAPVQRPRPFVPFPRSALDAVDARAAWRPTVDIARALERVRVRRARRLECAATTLAIAGDALKP